MKTIAKTVRFEPGIHKLIEDQAHKNHFDFSSWVRHLICLGLTTYYSEDEIQRAKEN